MNAILEEVVSCGITSDKALSELKKAKDKLDVNFITKEEYDKIKADLTKYKLKNLI